MRCIFCGKDVRATTVTAFDDHGPGICAKEWTHKQRIEQDENNPDLFSLYEEGGPSVPLTRSEMEHLVGIMCSALKWTAGPDLNLNPSHIPTRHALYEAVAKSELRQTFVSEFPDLGRVATALAIQEQYNAWLPEQHRVPADYDLKYLARRMEELVRCYHFFRDLKRFQNQTLSSNAAAQLWSLIRQFVGMLKQITGTDLWA
jgi:hypothetical protein